VVAPETCGLGGDLFALVHRPGWERPRALNASGRAGSGADAEELRRLGLAEIPRDHPLTVTIPGCVSGWAALNRELGSLSLAACLTPAKRHAAEGFEVSTEQARAFRATSHMYLDHPAVAGFYPGGEAVTAGDHVVRPDLAATLEAICSGGPDAFYLGQPGQDIVDELGGLITAEDLAGHTADWVEPIGVETGGLTAWTTPPNSQGYLGPATVAVFEMLDAGTDPDSPDWWHLLVEAYRSMAWERNDVVADAEHAPLPPGMLLDPERLARAAASVDRGRAGVWPERVGAASGTAYLCVVDDDRTAVSIIHSNYRGTGSAFGARRSGFLLQDRGGGFSLTPGHPNELGPGKRPLHTLSPTLWTSGTATRWVIGTRGGAVQPQLVAQVAARLVLAGDTAETAQMAPRWTVQEFGPGSPPSLMVEPGVTTGILSSLGERGHQIEVMHGPQGGWGPVSVIGVDGPELTTARDPRVDTTSAIVV
jgi:gamma-glutamyltranspeptidase / glutathione hydrolase